MTKYPASCDTFGVNTLCSVSGFGYADQLTENNNFEFTATIVYDTNCLPFVQLGTTSFLLPSISASWNNQCHSLPFHHNLLLPPDSFPQSNFTNSNNYAYGTVPEPSTITAPEDVTIGAPDFFVNVCPLYEQTWSPYGFDFDCPDQDYELIMPMTSGYHLNTTYYNLTVHVSDSNSVHSKLYYDNDVFVANHFPTCSGPSVTLPSPTIQEFYTPTDYVVMNFGRLPHCNCGNNYSAADVLSCFNVPLELDCTGNSHYSEDPLSFSFQFVCDTASNACAGCGDTLTSQSTVTYHHCSGTCPGVVPFTNEGFSFSRTNIGWRNLKLAADSFYTTCNSGMALTPSNLVEDTLVIDSLAAYPGDQIEAIVTGGYNSAYICKNDTNMFLQIRFQPVVTNALPPHFAFELDPTMNSTFTITGNSVVPSLNGIPLVIPPTTGTVFTVGDWEAMNFSLTRAIQNSAYSQWVSLLANDTLGDSLAVYADIHLRVTSGPTNQPFTYGEHLINLRTEFMDITNTNIVPPPAGDSNPSCDSWGAQFNIYQPGTDIGFNADQYTITDCNPFQPAIRFRCNGAANSYFTDDFPNEFRPFAELDSIVTVVVPAGYIFDSANYLVQVDNYVFNGSTNYFAGGQNPHFFRVTPTYQSNPYSANPNLEDSIIFVGLNNSCFPLMDEKFYNGDGTTGQLYLYTQPVCNAPETSTFYYYAGYKLGTQQSDPAFQYDTNVKGYLHVIHQNPIVNIKSPHTVSDSSNTITFEFTLCDSLYPATEAWCAIQNYGGNKLLLSTATLENLTTHTYCDSIFYNSDSALLFKVGSIPTSTCYQMLLTATIDSLSTSCPVPVGVGTGKLILFYGNVCGDTITVPDLSCEDRVDTLTYNVFKTTLEIFNDSHNFDTISLCSGTQFIDTLTIESADIGIVSNPIFWAKVIPGVTIDSVTFTFPCGGSKDTTFKYPPVAYYPSEFDTDVVSSSGGGIIDVGWILNKDLGIDGLRGGSSLSANNTICAIAYMSLNCQYNTHDSLEFYVSGISTCDIVISDSVSILPKVVDTACCNANCWTHSRYDLTINNVDSRSLSSLHGYVACEDILVIGTFTVDSDFTFANCNVAFAPGAMINVIKNSTLSITNASSCSNGFGCPHLYAACNSMWRGIFVYPGSMVRMYKTGLVEDADSAIVSINSPVAQGLYNLSGFVFNRNYKDIVVRPCPKPFNGVSTFCVYTCRNLDTVPACNAFSEYYLTAYDTIIMPFINKRTQMGWDIDSVDLFQDFGYNTFDNMVRGIYARSTDLSIGTDLFMHINAKSDTDAAIYDKGIIILGGNKLVVGGAGGNGNTFEDCTTGVYAQSYFQYVYVSDNVFHDKIPPSNFAPITIGVLTKGQMMPAFRMYVDSNQIDSARFGVVGVLNEFGKVWINYNRILGDGRCVPNQEQGIRLQDLTTSSIAYHIEDNSINDMHYGIYANGINYPIIYQDTVALGGDLTCMMPLSGRGITLSNSLGASIVDNTVSLPYHTNPLDYVGKHFYGIYAEDCKNAQILCNTTYYLDTAIACNGRGDIGNPPLHPFEVLGNHMTAGPNTLNSTGIEIAGGAALGVQGSASVTSDNEWEDTTNFTCRSKVPSPSIASASPFYVWTGSVYNPDAGSCIPYIAIFPPGTSSHYNCSGLPPKVSGSAILDSIATNQMTYLQYPDTSSRISKSALTTILWNDDSLLGTPLFHHFNDSISGVSLGQLMAVDTTLTSTSGYDATVLLSTANAITPASNVEANIQATQQVYLQAQISNADTLPQTSLIAMRNLANLCPDFDGYGVYQARALLDYYDTTFTIYDNDNCVNDDNRDRFIRNNHGGNSDTTKNVEFNLYPNPNNGNFTIEYDLGSETSGSVEIYNQVGMKVAEYLLSSPKGKMDISNPNLSQSVYIYKLYSNSGVKKIGKIVIVK